MIDDKRERRTALWWIEHESTNEFWSLRNPWVVGPLVLLVVIVLCALATFFWGMPRVVADVITKGIVFGYHSLHLPAKGEAPYRSHRHGGHRLYSGDMTFFPLISA